MMKVLFLLAALFCVSQAFVSPITYNYYARLRGDYLAIGGSQNLKGLLQGTYDANTMQFNYQVISNLQSIGAVEIHGPAACSQSLGGFVNWQDPASAFCISKTGPVVETLGRGLAPTTTGTTSTTLFQSFKGTLTLTKQEEAMLFDGELYIVMNGYTTGADGKTQVETPSIRGNIAVHSLGFYNNMAYDSFNVYFSLAFSGSGSYPGFAQSGSASTGVGQLYFRVVNGAVSGNSLSVFIFSTIATPGTYVLKCGPYTQTLNNNQNNPNPLDTTITITPPNGQTNHPIFFELLAANECFIYITSSAYPDGDLFAWVTAYSQVDATLTGALAQSNSPYFARALASFDYGSKAFSYTVLSNITTSTVTQVFLEMSNGTMVCNLTVGINNPSNINARSCYVNESYVQYMNSKSSDQMLYINIYSTSYPSGELKGALSFSSKSASAFGISAPVNSLAIGLGVGLGIGIPVLILLIVGAVFFVKRSGSKGV